MHELKSNELYQNLSILQPPCKRLWCTTSEGEAHGCRTQHMPWADGTPCGPSKWCMKSECVPMIKKPSPVHGNWGEWSR